MIQFLPALPLQRDVIDPELLVQLPAGPFNEHVIVF